MAYLTAKAAQLRADPDIASLEGEARKDHIRLKLIGTDLDPDDETTIDTLDRLTRAPIPVTLRFKEATGLSDIEIAGLLGKSRPTISAYTTGRRIEYLTDDDLAVLRRYISQRIGTLKELASELPKQ